MASAAKEVHKPERFAVEVRDPDEVGRHLEAAYGARLRLVRTPHVCHDGRTLLSHARVDVGSFAIDEVQMPGEVKAAPDPLNSVVVAWVTGGRLATSCDGIEGKAVTGEITLLSQPDLGHHGVAEDVEVTSLLMDPDLVASVATGLPIGHAPAVRFGRFSPVDAAAGQLWKETVGYIKDSVLSNDEMATPLVLGNAARLLAAVTLSTFPNTATVTSTPHDRVNDGPALLRRAIAYMESNASNDIAIADIADAVHLTPRAVQYMFRRHLGTTPFQYLRRLRLSYAHQDLVVSDRMHATVTEIAAKWGFVHTGRFAVLYREAYGQSPHTTLRGD
jgi:AraC-like DNA-binding protein